MAENGFSKTNGDRCPSSAENDDDGRMFNKNLVLFNNHFTLINIPDKPEQQSTIVSMETKRPVFTLEQYNRQLGAKSMPITLREKLTRNFKRKIDACTLSCWLSALVSLFPIVDWLPKYDYKKSLLSDVLTGLTVGIMSIPQGMAYARLAGMPPVYGLYTNLVPTIVYVFFGTSKQAAIGAATVMSLMMGSIRYKYIPCEDCWQRTNTSGAFMNLTDEGATKILTPIELGSATAFLVGIMLLFMGLIRLNFITTYLSDQIVGGFTAGAAVHIFSAQLDAMFGLKFEKGSGVGHIVMIYVQFFKTIQNTNVATLIISMATLILLLILKMFINPIVERKIKVHLPGELFAVIIGTMFSYFLKLHTTYNVKIVDHVPSNLPSPIFPRFDLMGTLLLDSFILATLTYCQAISQAKLYANRHSYKIDTRQEFFAYGLFNLAGSFFQCFNSGMSISRTIVYEKSGGKSQIAGLIGTSIVILTILVLAPYLEPLPQGVLAAIIMVACISLFLQMKELKYLWQTSKYDCAIYIFTFMSVVFLDVSYGLLCSVVFALFSVIIRTQCQTVLQIGQVVGTDLYAETNKFSAVDEVPGIKVIYFQAPLYYANSDKFKSSILKSCQLKTFDKDLANGNWGAHSGDPICIDIPSVRHLIINCVGIVYVDLMGVDALKQIYLELKTLGITVWFAQCNRSVEKMIRKTKLFDVVPKDNFFVTVHGAFVFVNELEKSKGENNK